jgi:hypothetical protein
MLVLAITIYVTLDLSLAAMPGAFVFEPAQTVETAQSRNGRGAIELMVPIPVAMSSVAPPPPRLDVIPGAGPDREDRSPIPRPAVDHRPRETLEPTPSLEDAH